MSIKENTLTNKTSYMNYNFKQKTFFGEILDAELVNIPDNAIFYKVDENNWYVIIPDCKENTMHFRGKNCFAVHTYMIFGYAFISLKNIIVEGWEDSKKLLDDFFKNKYILRYKKSDPHNPIESFRIKGLALNDSVFTTRVFANDVCSVIDTFNMKMFYIEDMALDIYDPEYSSDIFVAAIIEILHIQCIFNFVLEKLV